MELTSAEVCARWPALSPLLTVADPPWRFTTLAAGGMLVGTREHESYVDVLWYVAERAGANRRPLPDRAGPVIQQEAVAGSLPAALEVLLRPAKPARR